MRFAALILALILASCSGDSQTTEPPAPAPTLTSIAESAPPETSTTTTAAVETTTTSTTTTTTLPPNAAPAFALSQVVFGDAAFVVITNWGNDVGTLDGFWLSQGDALQALPEVSLAPGEQALIGLGPVAPPELTGFAAVVDLGIAVGTISPKTGELALHSSTAFDDPSELVAYVAWGQGLHQRSELATTAGLWDGNSVEVFDDAPSISSGVYPAANANDWSADIGG